MTTLDPNTFSVPDELVFEIFSRLPLKSIARCRCVCKLWTSLLRRQDFTDSFLTKSCARPHIIFSCRDHSQFFFSSAPQPQNLQGNSYDVVATKHLAPFSTSSRVVGYTNGFFLFFEEQLSELLFELETVARVVNHSTGQSLTLPTLNPWKGSGRTTCVLGYDPIAKDFKVLSMTSHVVNGAFISAEYQVLTLGTQTLSWRKVECYIPHLPTLESICISGVLYYIPDPGSMVFCFDLRTEKFSCVKFFSDKSKPTSLTLVNYNGKFGLLMSEDFNCVFLGSIDLWVLQDAAKHEWSKHVYMLPPLWKDVVAEGIEIVGMIGTNEIVFSPCFRNGPSYVIYYNVESKMITKVGVHGIHGMHVNTILNYVENVKLL